MHEDDVASRYLFDFGCDIVVRPHDATSSAHPIAGLSLLFLLVQHDQNMRTGGQLHVHPDRRG